MNIEKGMKVRFTVSKITTPSLAGVQMKVQLSTEVVEGVITDVRGTRPNATDPKDIGIVLKTDEGDRTIEAHTIVGAEVLS